MRWLQVLAHDVRNLGLGSAVAAHNVAGPLVLGRRAHGGLVDNEGVVVDVNVLDTPDVHNSVQLLLLFVN